MFGSSTDGRAEPDGGEERGHRAAVGVLLALTLHRGIVDFLVGIVNFLINLPGYILEALFVVGTTAVVVVITVAIIIGLVAVPYGVYVGGVRLYHRVLPAE